MGDDGSTGEAVTIILGILVATLTSIGAVWFTVIASAAVVAGM